MSLVTVTFVRHGESTDNLKTIWAGWKDSPLSNHGMNQAKAAAKYFVSTNTKFTAIYASPLKRAYTTAQVILSEQPHPKPAFIVSSDVREQHFGIAEGNTWIFRTDEDLTREECYARGVYPIIYNRTDSFPEGESLDDLQARAERAIKVIVMPHVWTAMQTGQKAHIAIVSHELCISELIATLMRKDRDIPTGAHGGKWTGLGSTAWTRVTIDVVGPNERRTAEINPTGPPLLKVKVTHINEHSHLDNVVRKFRSINRRATAFNDFMHQKRQQGTRNKVAPPIKNEEGYFDSDISKYSW